MKRIILVSFLLTQTSLSQVLERLDNSPPSPPSFSDNLFVGIKPVSYWRHQSYRFGITKPITTKMELGIDAIIGDRHTQDTSSKLLAIVVSKQFNRTQTFSGLSWGPWIGYGILSSKFRHAGIETGRQSSVISLGPRIAYRWVRPGGEFVTVGLSPGVWIARNQAKIAGRTLDAIDRPWFDLGLDDLVTMGISF